MTIQQFDNLSETDKIVAIVEFGKLLAQNLEDRSRTFLYKVESFYVSTTYQNENDDLNEIHSYSEVNQSTPHFRKIIFSIHPAARSGTLN